MLINTSQHFPVLTALMIQCFQRLGTGFRTLQHHSASSILTKPNTAHHYPYKHPYFKKEVNKAENTLKVEASGQAKRQQHAKRV